MLDSPGLAEQDLGSLSAAYPGRGLKAEKKATCSLRWPRICSQSASLQATADSTGGAEKLRKKGG